MTTWNTVNLWANTLYDFSGLTSATQSSFALDVAMPFAKLADIDGSSILVSGGVTIAMQ